MNNKVNSEHGIVCRLPGPFGYFGWPSIARMDDGTLVVASSGLRVHHVCPWGKTVLNYSSDNGKTWSEPVVINDSPIDDRDAGVISLGGRKLLISWFTIDTRKYCGKNDNWIMRSMSKEEYDIIIETISKWDNETVCSHLGSWVRTNDNGNEWKEPIRVPVSAPHGPILLLNGDIIYFGKSIGDYRTSKYLLNGTIRSIISKDKGMTWNDLGEVPIPEDTENDNYHEPHIVELSSGKLIGMIRYEHSDSFKNHEKFSIFQTESNDGGKTWSKAKPTGVCGSPPHLIRHSSGAIICVYGYREKPYGERAMISYDDGATWETDIILKDDAPDWDLGYPASAELNDGSILTIYYQKYAEGEKPSLLWTRWRLPE